MKFTPVLAHRLNHKAPSYARQRAAAFKHVGDHEGHAVWLSVAATADRLLNEVQKPQEAYF